MEQMNKIKHLRDKKLEHFWEQGWNMVMTSSEPRKKPSQRLALKPVLPPCQDSVPTM